MQSQAGDQIHNIDSVDFLPLSGQTKTTVSHYLDTRFIANFPSKVGLYLTAVRVVAARQSFCRLARGLLQIFRHDDGFHCSIGCRAGLGKGWLRGAKFLNIFVDYLVSSATFPRL